VFVIFGFMCMFMKFERTFSW